MVPTGIHIIDLIDGTIGMVIDLGITVGGITRTGQDIGIDLGIIPPSM